MQRQCSLAHFSLSFKLHFKVHIRGKSKLLLLMTLTCSRGVQKKLDMDLLLFFILTSEAKRQNGSCQLRGTRCNTLPLYICEATNFTSPLHQLLSVELSSPHCVTLQTCAYVCVKDINQRAKQLGSLMDR